ncbi:MAG TPA: sigma-70 family RNA polymerase sigma factor [Alphaproteobacteria bacterium]|nr:sigma-70 family RNA polymerase sigma factor [Alphaproteobacteria bacterium]
MPRERLAAADARFLKSIGDQPFLSPEEEDALARRALAGDAAAEERLICSHLRFVARMARAYRSYGLPLSDLLQEGTVALIQAIRRYDPNRGARLATYAMWSIRAALQEQVVSSWSLVRIGTTATQRRLFLKLRRLSAELREGADALGEEVYEALSRRFGLPAPEVAALAARASARDRSLDAPSAPALRDDRPDPEAAADARLWSGLLDKALAMLPEREAAIIRARYFRERAASFAGLGRELGLSKDRVRQLEEKALGRLLSFLSSAEPPRSGND